MRTNMYGWTGKILSVDLSTGRIKNIPTGDYTDKYLGGRGIATRLYQEKVRPETKAFDPDNRLVFMTGPLVATGAQGATRMSVVGKSPMTLPEGYCYGNIGGFFPAELKKAGYDGIIVDGQASEPVDLWIHDGIGELRDASFLWGLDAYRTAEILDQKLGGNIRFLATGPAGENLVRTAVITGSHHGTVSGGFGAVMGAKNLKVIAVRGTGKVPVADPEKLRKLNRYTIKISRRVHLSVPPRVIESGRANLLEVAGKGGCYQCGMQCVRTKYIYDKRRDLEGTRKCESQEYYLPWLYGKNDEPIDTFFNAPTLANDYSICIFELENMVDWLYACHRAGVLTEKETGLPLSEIGTRAFLEKLLDTVSHRRGFGNVLAEGLIRAGEKIPPRAREMYSHAIAPVGTDDWFPPRTHLVNALLYPLEPRVNQAVLNHGGAETAWIFHQLQPELSPVSSGVLRKISGLFWGSETAADESTYEGKALAAVKIQNRMYVDDCLGLCDWAFPITYSFDTTDNLGDPELEVKIFAAVTGINADNLEKYGEFIANQQRMILIREGRQLPRADYPPEYNFTEPLGISGVHAMAPGPGDEVLDMANNKLDKDKFTGMLKEYYRLRGWDTETGIPLPDTLASYGLEA